MCMCRFSKMHRTIADYITSGLLKKNNTEDMFRDSVFLGLPFRVFVVQCIWKIVLSQCYAAVYNYSCMFVSFSTLTTSVHGSESTNPRAGITICSNRDQYQVPRTRIAKFVGRNCSGRSDSDTHSP